MCENVPGEGRRGGWVGGWLHEKGGCVCVCVWVCEWLNGCMEKGGGWGGGGGRKSCPSRKTKLFIVPEVVMPLPLIQK